MEENKYYHDMDNLMPSEEESRNLRKKRRRRSRILAWIAFVLILGALGAGGVYLYKYTTENMDHGTEVSFSGSTETTVSAEEPDKEQEIVASLNTEEEKIELDPSEFLPKPPTEEELFVQAIEQYVAAMSIADKVAGLFIVSPEQITGVQTAVLAGEGTRQALAEYAVGGIVYSAKNITGASNFKEMLSKTREMSRRPIFLAISEETGFGTLAGAIKGKEKTEKAADIGATGDSNNAYQAASLIASYLKEYGIDLNLGLVADVLTDPDNETMKEHSFSSDADICAGMVSQMATAYSQWGITACLKSFPGEGSASKSGLFSVERTLDEMKNCEFKSFLSGIESGADMLMVSHIYAPNVTGDNEQCSRSRTLLTDIIRIEYGLDDLIIITDALNKPAISDYYDSEEAAIDALKAGADMLLLPENFKEAYEGIFRAVTETGVVSIERIDASLVRIYKVKFKGLSSAEIDAMTGAVNAPVNDGASGNNK